MLEFILLPFLTVGLLFCWVSAWPGGMVLRFVARVSHWEGDVTLKQARRAVFWSLLAYIAVAGIIDYAVGTNHSLLSLLPVINRPLCAPECYSFTPPEDYRSPIGSTAAYYGTVVGAGTAAWLRYALWQVPAFLALVGTLVSLNPWESKGHFALPGLGVAALAITAISLGVVMPTIISLAVGLRSTG